MDNEHLRGCERCGDKYDWRRSTSGSLKMTYCGTLCEKGALGFTIETILNGIQVLRREWQPLLAL